MHGFLVDFHNFGVAGEWSIFVEEDYVRHVDDVAITPNAMGAAINGWGRLMNEFRGTYCR